MHFYSIIVQEGRTLKILKSTVVVIIHCNDRKLNKALPKFIKLFWSLKSFHFCKEIFLRVITSDIKLLLYTKKRIYSENIIVSCTAPLYQNALFSIVQLFPISGHISRMAFTFQINVLELYSSEQISLSFHFVLSPHIIMLSCIIKYI